MKIEVIIEGEKKSYTLVQLVNEPMETKNKNVLGVTTSGYEMVTMAYCYDKLHKPFKFLASQIERYD